MAESQMFETLRMVARRLDEQHVDWLVFAGAAAVAYGADRPLTDVDILVPAHEGEGVARLFYQAHHVRTDAGWLLCIELPGVDIVPGLSLFEVDEEMLSRAEWHPIGGMDAGGINAPMIPVEDNVLLKAMLGRGADEGKHDWEDVAAMLAHRPELDWDYLLWRANEIPNQEGVDEVLDRLRAMR